MPNAGTSCWKPLARWSPTLFLAAGVFFVGHAAVRGIEAFTAMPPPIDVFGPAGYVVAILGLLGVYPALADRSRRIARLAAGTAGVTAPAWLLIAGWNFGEAAGMLPPQTDVLPGAFFAVVVAATLLLYLLFGIASLRAGVHARSFGVLLLAPVALLALLIVGGVFLSIASETGGVVIGGGMTIIHGAIGGTLATGRMRTDRAEPSADALTE